MLYYNYYIKKFIHIHISCCTMYIQIKVPDARGGYYFFDFQKHYNIFLTTNISIWVHAKKTLAIQSLLKVELTFYDLHSKGQWTIDINLVYIIQYLLNCSLYVRTSSPTSIQE